MSRCRKPRLVAEAERRNQLQLAALGGQLRESRRRRGLTQQQVGGRAGLSQSAISVIERGSGGSLSLDTLQRVAGALGRSLRVDLGRDPFEEPSDAGHLAMQELILRLGRFNGHIRTVELPSSRVVSNRSTDVALVDSRSSVLVLVECFNTFGDLGASIRSSDRKREEAEALAIAVGGGHPLRVGSCWVVKATARNRAVLTRYPELFASRFPASSTGWVRALTSGSTPPFEPGLVWCNVAATRIFARRLG
jgi:transcriptional regulator with XRE-family HTH domain